MNDATGDEDNIAYDEDEEDEDADVEDEAAMGIGTMQVHDMHLGDSTPAAGPPKPAEAAAAAAPAAAAADGSASARFALKCLFSCSRQSLFLLSATFATSILACCASEVQCMMLSRMHREICRKHQ